VVPPLFVAVVNAVLNPAVFVYFGVIVTLLSLEVPVLKYLDKLPVSAEVVIVKAPAFTFP